MKKEIYKYIFGALSNKEGLGKKLLVFASICLFILFLAVGTTGYVAYRVVSHVWQSETSANIKGMINETIRDSKDALSNQQINTTSCLQEIKNTLSLNALLNLENSIQALRQACLQAQPSEEKPQAERVSA